MKKILFVALTLIASVFSVFADDDVTGRALTMRTQVQAFLKSEGYVPTVDSDGDISFKVEGKNYYISFENYDDGVYVDLYTILGTEGENQYKVLKAANTAQHSLKFIRINALGTDALSFNFCHFFESASQFKTLFPDMIQVVKTGRQRTIDNFAEL